MKPDKPSKLSPKVKKNILENNQFELILLEQSPDSIFLQWRDGSGIEFKFTEEEKLRIFKHLGANSYE